MGCSPPIVRGVAARTESSLAAVLGQCVSTGGNDPMRSNPFAADELAHSDPAAARALLAALARVDVPGGTEDPRSPVGKGRAVFGHENLQAGLDAFGFCSFSAAGLLLDATTPHARALDALARQLFEEGEDDPEPGRRLLALGASVVLRRRRLDARWAPDAASDVPAWAADALAEPGMLDEYRLVRGIDDRGRPLPAALDRIGTPEAAEPVAAPPEPAEPRARESSLPGGPPRRRPAEAELAMGAIVLRSIGPLAEKLPETGRVELALPAKLLDVLNEVARRSPGARRYLLRDRAPLCAVYRAGRRLDPKALVGDGDVLDLVLAVRGG